MRTDNGSNSDPLLSPIQDTGDITGPRLRVGQEPVPGYALVSLLGQGGFGEVWKAVGPGGVPVAMKLCRFAGGASLPEKRWLELLKEVRHPHLVSYVGYWEVGDTLIFAMELADRTLLDRLHEAQKAGLGGIPGPELIEYMREAAKGIDYLNGPHHLMDSKGPAGIQHRDIKPQNLLLMGGAVKVSDYGQVKLMEKGLTAHTGGLTVAYAPPEFFEDHTSDRSDQYSLAVTYCVLRGGRLPFSGNYAHVMAGHLEKEPDLSMIPAGEQSVVARALAKKPEDRWPNCRVFVEALAGVVAVGGDTSAIKAGTPAFQATPDSTTQLPQKTLPVPSIPFARRPSVKLAVWAMIFIAAALIAAYFGGLFDQPIVMQDDRQEKAQRHFQKGLELKAQGEHEKAIAEFSLALDTRGPFAEAYHERGLLHAKNKDFTLAIKDFDLALQLEIPKSAKALFHHDRALAQLSKGELDQAIASCDQAVTLKEDFALAFVTRARAYNQKGLSKTKALRDAAKALELAPNLIPAHVVHAQTLIYLDEYDAAVEVCDHALALRPGNSETIDLLLTRAQAGSAGKDYRGALADCDKVLALSPKNAAALVQKAEVYLSRNQVDQAVETLTQAQEMDPGFAPAFRERAKAFLIRAKTAVHKDPPHSREKDYREALNDLNRSLLKDPWDSEAYHLRGDTHVLLEDYSLAIEDYGRILEITPLDSVALNQRGWAHFKKGDNKRALADLNRAIKINPELETAYFHLGEVHLAEKNFASAIKDVSEAIKRNPKDARYFDLRAEAYQRNGDPALAREDREQAKKLRNLLDP